jgi:YD repeat-containing protein
MSSGNLAANRFPATLAGPWPPARPTAWQPIETLPHDYDLPFIHCNDDGMLLVYLTDDHGWRRMRVTYGRYGRLVARTWIGRSLRELEIRPGAYWAPIPT